MHEEFSNRVRSASNTATSNSSSTLSDPFTVSSGSSASSVGVTSPVKRKASTVLYSDRFIPSRNSEVDLPTNFNLLNDPPTTPRAKRKTTTERDVDARREEADRTFNALLRTELFGSEQVTEDMYQSPSSSKGRSRKLFTYRSPTKRESNYDSPTRDAYLLSPVRAESQKLLLSPRKTKRHISKTPFKVLDAPELQDDFYLNLVDWSSTNILGVGLGSCVYLWNACTSKVTKLCDLSPHDQITSVAWTQKGSHLAIGTKKGTIQLWDAARCKRMRMLSGHLARVGALSWNEHVLTSGSRDRVIYHRDVRAPDPYFRKLTEHRQEVCGLRWSPDGSHLASGGNDNKLLVWDKFSDVSLHRFTEHTAAVKAIAWSPHQHGLLASGGGTQDQRIRFWNTLTGAALHNIHTGSQVCNLSWSKTANELVSTHGFSQNQVVIWRYPSMEQLAVLTGHTYRVLYLAMSPDGQTIVTGAGDETLRFWNVFNRRATESRDESLLDAFSQIR
ncbi:uncharacterized protein VTP21DRAFT_6324 [Calcarisporiella thermophila]|uniref:uncharacterized protein n=1 Tax=Calcarisporiella thermophila TaxID=911321 RepID=UPI0037437957